MSDSKQKVLAVWPDAWEHPQSGIASAQEVIAELYEALKPFPGSPRFSDSDDDEDEWWCCCCDAAAQKIGDELKHEDDCIIACAWKALARAESLRKEAKQ